MESVEDRVAVGYEYQWNAVVKTVSDSCACRTFSALDTGRVEDMWDINIAQGVEETFLKLKWRDKWKS